MTFPEPPAPTYSEDGQLTNWVEIQTWGYHNSRSWQEVQKRCDHLKLKEVDRLRITCAVLLVEAERYKAVANKILMEHPNILFP